MIEQAELMTQPNLELLLETDEGFEVEGTEDTPDAEGGSIVEPFDPTLIRVSTVPLTVDLLVTRLRNDEIDLAPDFQRRAGIWTDTAQSRLIESMLIKIPLPAIYIDATDEGKWLVVDGLQRLTTLKNFIINRSLKLTNMEFLNELNGKLFDQIPRNYQRRIMETQLTVYQIEKGTPGGVKFNIFKRINTGGLPLSAQEIRHALNQGPVTVLLNRLAESAEFKKATNNSVKSDRMADRECVLRFLAFLLMPYNDYRAKDFDTFLNEAMQAINTMPQQQVEELDWLFRRAMTAAGNLFGHHAFRKISRSRTLPINKPLFEAWSVNLAKLTDEQLNLLIKRQSEVRGRMNALFDDYNFDSAISLATGDRRKIILRFALIEELIAEVLK